MKFDLGTFTTRADADAACENLDLKIGDCVRFFVRIDHDDEPRQYELTLVKSIEISTD